MLLNFWNKDELVFNFIDLFQVSGNQMANLLQKILYNKEEDPVALFCKETGFKLDRIAVANNVELIGKIVSTSIDNCAFLKEHGILHLDELLEFDSPISKHLLKYGISINASHHMIDICGKTLYLPDANGICGPCSLGKEECVFQEYQNNCLYYQAVSLLHNKLYHDNSEIEMFLVANKDDMLGYSTVSNFPEIFSTIEDLVYDITKKRLTIGFDWMKQSMGTFIISLPVHYDDLSFKTNYLCGGDLDSDIELVRYSPFLEDGYRDSKDVPKKVWDNIWLIKSCLGLIADSDDCLPELYAGIKREVQIPYDVLTITPV